MCNIVKYLNICKSFTNYLVNKYGYIPQSGVVPELYNLGTVSIYMIS